MGERMKATNKNPDGTTGDSGPVIQRRRGAFELNDRDTYVKALEDKNTAELKRLIQHKNIPEDLVQVLTGLPENFLREIGTSKLELQKELLEEFHCKLVDKVINLRFKTNLREHKTYNSNVIADLQS